MNKCVDRHDDDPSVVRAVLEGDPESFRVLVERYQRPLLSMVQNLIRDAVDSEDIAQETFLAAYVNLAAFDQRCGTFTTWLFTIARNRCFNYLKRCRPTVVADLPTPAELQTPVLRAAENEAFCQLDVALDALPIDQKTAFVLFEFQGMSHREISAIETTTIGTVKSRISRARQKLRVALRNKWEV